MTAIAALLGLGAVFFAVLAVRSRHPRQVAGAISATAIAGAVLLAALGVAQAAWAEALVGGVLVPLVLATASQRRRSRRHGHAVIWPAAALAAALAAATALPALVRTEPPPSPVEARVSGEERPANRPLLALLIAAVCLPLTALVATGTTTRHLPPRPRTHPARESPR